MSYGIINYDHLKDEYELGLGLGFRCYTIGRIHEPLTVRTYEIIDDIKDYAYHSNRVEKNPLTGDWKASYPDAIIINEDDHLILYDGVRCVLAHGDKIYGDILDLISNYSIGFIQWSLYYHDRDHWFDVTIQEVLIRNIRSHLEDIVDCLKSNIFITDHEGHYRVLGEYNVDHRLYFCYGQSELGEDVLSYWPTNNTSCKFVRGLDTNVFEMEEGYYGGNRNMLGCKTWELKEIENSLILCKNCLVERYPEYWR